MFRNHSFTCFAVAAAWLFAGVLASAVERDRRRRAILGRLSDRL